MGRSTSIADVGMSIVKLLRRELVPDTLQNPDAVGLCSPTDRGDYMVGIHLYDIRESEELRVNTMIARGTEELQYPPSYVNLYYMITVTSTGDIKFRSGEEHKILGRIIQILADHPCLDRETLEPKTVRKQLDVEISMQNLTLEDKMRISAYQMPVISCPCFTGLLRWRSNLREAGEQRELWMWISDWRRSNEWSRRTCTAQGLSGTGTMG